MEKKSSHKLKSTFVLGARPPQELSPKAKRQLASIKPSKVANELADKAAKLMPMRGVCAVAAKPAESAVSKRVDKK